MAGSVAAQHGTSVDRADTLAAYPRVTLEQAIARAIAASPLVASGIGGVRNAASFERVTRGAYLPKLSTTTTANVTDMVGKGAFSGGAPISRYATFGLTTALEVYTGGRRRAEKDVARADSIGAQWTLDSARYTARLSAELAFYEVVRAMDLVRVARAGVAEANLLVRYTRDMNRAGTATHADVLRAEVQAATLQTQLLAARDTLVAASFQLGWVSGANGPLSVASDSASEAVRALAFDDSAIVRLAVDSSPSVRVANANVAATESALRAARASYLPTITAGATYNRTTSPQVAIGSVFPIFTGYQRADTVTRAEVAAYVARATAADTHRSVRANAARLLSTLQTTVLTISLATEAVRSATEDLRVQTARYRAGIATMLDVLTSQTTLVQSGYSLAQARNQYHTTRAAIEALVGRTL
jgi:outer membrane protein